MVTTEDPASPADDTPIPAERGDTAETSEVDTA